MIIEGTSKSTTTLKANQIRRIEIILCFWNKPFIASILLVLDMGSIGKGFSLLLVVILAVSSLMMVESASAQSIPKPSVPEFTLKYVDNSYDVPPMTTSSTDPYTGKVTFTTIPGYHVENKSVEITIKNQPFTSYLNENGSRVWLFYYVAVKGHFENWSYHLDANYWLKQKLSESYPPGLALTVQIPNIR